MPAGICDPVQEQRMVIQTWKKNQSIYWAVWMYFVQIPFVYWYAAGLVPFHPIVVMLPLVGLVNYTVEKHGHAWLGLFDFQLGKAFLLALFFAALTFCGRLLVLRWGSPTTFGISFPTSFSDPWFLLKELLVSVFILALFEETVNRGFIQTRLQAAWGFWGVVLATLMFTSLHVPDLMLQYQQRQIAIFNALLRVSLVGFLLSYVYWWTNSLLTTLAIHGLNNFATSLFSKLFDAAPGASGMETSPLLIVWVFFQVVLAILVFHQLYGLKSAFSTMRDACRI
jgi:membrane protease YdiL (CAAX protease family)